MPSIAIAGLVGQCDLYQIVYYVSGLDATVSACGIGLLYELNMSPGDSLSAFADGHSDIASRRPCKHFVLANL